MTQIKKIKKNKKNTRLIFKFCAMSLILSSSLFLFYIVNGKNTTLSIVKQKDIQKNSVKLMHNPKIRFENDNGNFYDIKGETAKYNKDASIIAKKVTAISDSGTIISDILTISSDGNVIIFTGNAELEFFSNIIKKK
jgi:hypothetical protein|tara:strand:+ start:1858 stop:2268 length:411 start_codon:yes stop_codon:yes gene_type:complete